MASALDEPICHGDVRDDLNASVADKERLALNHFNCFLQACCCQIGVNVVEADAIPFRGVPRKTSNKAAFKWWDFLIGAFDTHMGDHARKGCDPKVGPCQTRLGSTTLFFHQRLFQQQVQE